MTTLTIPQTRARLERTLNAIWRAGDRDECSIKHTGYGLIALAFDRPWTDAVDYATPGGPGQDAGWYVSRLQKSWAKIAALREQVGHELWVEAVLSSEKATLRRFGYA